MNESTPSATRPPAGPRRRPWLRYLLIPVAVLLLAAVAVAAALPSLVSTDWGRDTAFGWVNDGLPGEVSVGNMSLSWLGGQSIQALAIRDPDGQPVLRLDALTTDLSLLGALRGKLSLGRTELRGLDANLVFGPDGTSNLAAALGTAPGGPEAAEGPGLVAPVTGNMALIDGRVAIAAPGIEPVVLDQLSGAVEMTSRSEPVKLSLQGRTRQGELAGRISADGRVSNLFTDGRLEPDAARADIQARIADLPVDALDSLLGQGGLLSTALGDRMSLDLQASGDAARQRVVVAARMPRGTLDLEGVVVDGRFTLSQPAVAELEVTPGLVDALTRAPDGQPAIRLGEAVPLRLTLNQLAFPLAGFNLAALAPEATLEARGPIRFTGIPEVGDAALNELNARVASPGLGEHVRVTVNGKPVTGGRTGSLALNAEVRNLLDGDGRFQPAGASVQAQSRLAGVPTSLADTVLGQNGLLAAALGPTLDLALDANTDASGRTGLSLTLDAERLKTGAVRLAVDEDLALDGPARIRFDLSPGLWRRLAGDEAAVRIDQPSTWTLELSEMRMPLPAGDRPAFQPGRTSVKAVLAAPSLALRTAADGAPINLGDLRLELAADTLDDIDLAASARVAQPGGPLAAMNASPLAVSLRARTGLKDDASLKAIASTLNLDSAGLRATLKTRVEEGLTRLVLAEPAAIDATVTPALLAADDGDGGASLRRAAGVRLTLERLALPLAPFDYAGLSAAGAIRVEALAIDAAGGFSGVIEVTDGTFRFDGSDRGRAGLTLAGRVRANEGEAGELSLDLSAGNLLGDAGGISTEAVSLDLKGRLQQLPSALIDQVLALDGMLTAALGTTADVAVESRLDKGRGPVSLALEASNTRADIKAALGEDGLTLTAPLTAQFQPTPEFGKKILSKVHPVFETTQRAEQPIRLEVPADGVLVPIESFELSRVAVPSMTLDFGRIVLRSGWLLRGIVGLGQQFGRMDNVQREEWVAWFTPGELAIRDGVVHYRRRLDLLLDQRLHLATWGKADIAGDRAELTLAFMPDTMERVFSITVAENDALHIPLTGPLSSPGVDFKKAAADLARLRAQEEVAGENPMAGLLLGSVGSKVTGGGPVPPPSVSPLPWADLLRQQEAAQPRDQATQPQDQATQPQQAAPEKQPSKEEQLIKGVIDLFGNKKKD